MGDIREFWLAVAIYVISGLAIFAILSMTVGANLHGILKVLAVLGGGFVLGTGVILLWAGVLEMCGKK